ncbi:unnamed protein product [Chondrus crispus]|uniref:Uncharacterized protein n=1 Tax=Chondrus crispus TaxID=2769 RepID=R7QNC9_CHOCR|nr:unnamed protein product [Chondrus crispus]CDF39604.1 unnamed protein product [Chondrus crispus]|eukprot:XP_005709898.1 unnamed protein product [Chondrus crispus]
MLYNADFCSLVYLRRGLPDAGLLRRIAAVATCPLSRPPRLLCALIHVAHSLILIIHIAGHHERGGHCTNILALRHLLSNLILALSQAFLVVLASLLEPLLRGALLLLQVEREADLLHDALKRGDLGGEDVCGLGH